MSLPDFRLRSLEREVYRFRLEPAGPDPALRDAVEAYLHGRTMFGTCVECGRPASLCGVGPFVCAGGCPQGCPLGPLRAALAG